MCKADVTVHAVLRLHCFCQFNKLREINYTCLEKTWGVILHPCGNGNRSHHQKGNDRNTIIHWSWITKTGVGVLMNTECVSIIGCHKYLRVKERRTGRVRKQGKIHINSDRRGFMKTKANVMVHIGGLSH